jgi:DNA-binding GntR family transcriptional regulator
VKIERRPLRYDVRDALLQLIMAARLRPGALADEEVIDVSVSQHEAIVEALDRGDVAAAADAVEFNWRSGAVRLAAALSGEGQV